MYWDQLTSPQVAQIDKNTPVLLPISATEQHGAHLPLATDRMIGEHFCKCVHDAMTDNVLILPMMSIGCSEHHSDFAGSLSIQHVNFLNILIDIADSVTKYGFKNIILLNSHGGNQAIGQTFVEVFGYRNQNMQIAMLTWWRIALGQLIPHNQSGKGGCGHAGEFETSLMLHIAPHLVNMNLANTKSNVATYPWAEGDLLYGAKGSLYRTMQEMTPTGVYGSPLYGTKEKGKEISRIVTQHLVAIVRDMLSC